MIGIRRRIVLLGYSTLLFLLIGVAAGGLTVAAEGGHLDLADRLTMIGDIIAGSALLLSFIAALLALQAYAAVTGLPSLSIQVWFDASRKNCPVFTSGREENGWLVVGPPNRQAEGRISIYNRGLYSAHNPILIVRLEAMFVRDAQNFSEWVAVDEEDGFGVTVWQWDGGGDYYVHSKSVRRLPTLDLTGLCHFPEWGRPALRFEMLADGGYRRVVQMPVSIISDVATDDDESRSPIPGDWV